MSMPALSHSAYLAAEFGRLPDGQYVTTLGDKGTKAVVLFFVASDCPISNRTFPEMKRVREEFSRQGVRFWFVYPNSGELPKTVAQHQASYDAGGEAILDTTGVLTRMTDARATPEVVVLKPQSDATQRVQWVPVYAGRVDDRYVRLGLERPQATEHFAERVVREVLEDKPVEKAVGDLIGCAIMSPTAHSADGGHTQ
jgi:AhpC/TSA family